jgi:L-alanine-DL-glutamate epimerase-like enolase superfamily enzyme
VEAHDAVASVRRTRKLLGKRCEIRTDANMAWSVDQAIEEIRSMASDGVCSHEQPISADDLDGLARLVRETDADIMVDESLHDAESLDNLIALKACTAVNVRISKCGGLVAARERCLQATSEGLVLQIGCQVGESSLLSAAQLILLSVVRDVRYAEGCFGEHLLGNDPAEPLLQFDRGGKPPSIPTQPGLGVTINREILHRFARNPLTIE